MRKSEILLCSVLSTLTALMFGYYSLDNSIPAEDARSHIFKISMYTDYLNGNGTDWNQYWYSGIPFDDFYPPMYYLIGALINKLIANPIISYKITFSISMIIVGLSIYIMSRQLLSLSPQLSFISAIAFLTFPSVLKMYYYQTAPNFLSLGFSILAITFYKIISDSPSIKTAFLASLFTGLTLLTHPFPFLMILAALAWMIVKEISVKKFKSAISLILTLSGGLILASSSFLPALLMIKWASPIYVHTYDALGQFARGLIILMFTYTLICLLITLVNKTNLGKYTVSNVFFLTANAITFLLLGMGLAKILPLGRFLHEFRFTALSAPAFIIPLTILMIKYPVSKKLLILLPISLLLAANVMTYPEINLIKMHTRYLNHLTSDYREIVDHIDPDYRILIPPGLGRLNEGDSYVTLARELKIRSVNGPYNQGDPKFFDYTVLVEWQEKWLNIPYIRENLMQWGAAKYIFIRGCRKPDFSDLKLIVKNSYGSLWVYGKEVAEVINVSPILLDLSFLNERVVSYTFSYFMPKGYKFVLVNKNFSDKSSFADFKGVIVDSHQRAEYYLRTYPQLYVIQTIEGKTNLAEPCSPHNDRLITCYIPFKEIENYLYLGPEEEVSNWVRNDLEKPPLTEDIRKILSQVSINLLELLNPVYKPLKYKRVKSQKFKIISEYNLTPFILIKESYYPYWRISDNEGKIMRTTTGFILIYSKKVGPLELNYEKPALIHILPILTSLSFIGLFFLTAKLSIFQNRIVKTNPEINSPVFLADRSDDHNHR
ncbi:hypothetical protein DRO64_09865 [Candidatus Bathyarchaeota archaeon]|nr:MAG: hypothetical protein DRO64_09865 [Candidatus Bathyarchaeota archaeon]